MAETPEIAVEKTEREAPQPAPAASDAPQQAIDPATLPKTSGEKFYDVFQFFFGKVFIIAITAVLAFTSDRKYGPKKIGPVPNYLKTFQGWFHDKLLHNKVYPLEKKGDFARLFAGAAASTMTLSHGGNFFAPFIKWLENGREDICNFWNRRFGTEEEVQIAHERLKDTPKQNWADVAKGRVWAWGTVFGAILTCYAVIGKNKKSGHYWLDEYEDWFARKLAGTTKGGKGIAAIPISKPLNNIQKANKMYRFGKVLALDLYATSAAIVIWNFFSRMSARKRTEKERIAANQDLPHEFILTETLAGPESGHKHSKAASGAPSHEEETAPASPARTEADERAPSVTSKPASQGFQERIGPRRKMAPLGASYTEITSKNSPETAGHAML